MAQIISNNSKRRIVKLSVDDILSVVRIYQMRCKNIDDYLNVRKILANEQIYIPEDL